MNVFVARDGNIIRSKPLNAEWRMFLTTEAPQEISTALGMDISPLLKHRNLVITQETKRPKDGLSGYTEYNTGHASSGSVSFGYIPWDFHLSVYRPESYAHEFAHYIHFLSKMRNLVDLVYFDGPDGDLPPALSRLIQEISRADAESAEDNYLKDYGEWFARLFEVHISWRLDHVENRDSFFTTSPLGYWTSVYSGTESCDDIWHFTGYDHAFYWEHFQRRFHRAIRDLLRDLIVFMDKDAG